MSVERPFNNETEMLCGVIKTLVGTLGVFDTLAYGFIPQIFDTEALKHKWVFFNKISFLYDYASPDPVLWTVKTCLTLATDAGINPNLVLGAILVISTVLLADGVRKFRAPRQFI